MILLIRIKIGIRIKKENIFQGIELQKPVSLSKQLHSNEKLRKKLGKLRQGWEKLRHLLIWKGKTQVQEITKRICGESGEKCRSYPSSTQEQNDNLLLCQCSFDGCRSPRFILEKAQTKVWTPTGTRQNKVDRVLGTQNKSIPPKYLDFFKLGKLPPWNPQDKCDTKEVHLLIQLKEQVEAEKQWQMQRARTVSFNEVLVPVLANWVVMHKVVILKFNYY